MMNSFNLILSGKHFICSSIPFLNVFYWLCYYLCPIFSPLYSPLPIPPPTALPYLSSCPWAVHINSLVSPFPTLFLTSPLSILYLPFMLLIPSSFSPILSLSPPLPYPHAIVGLPNLPAATSPMWPAALPHVLSARLPICLSPPLLPVWMNVSLTLWLSEFHAVWFSGTSGCFLFLNSLLSFFWLCEKAKRFCLCLHLSWDSSIYPIFWWR